MTARAVVGGALLAALLAGCAIGTTSAPPSSGRTDAPSRPAPTTAKKDVDPAQVDKPDAIRVPVGHLRRGAQREPGLADSGWPGDRHQAGGAEQRGEVGELILAAHEAGGLRWQQPKPSRDGDLASGDDMGHGYLKGGTGTSSP